MHGVHKTSNEPHTNQEDDKINNSEFFIPGCLFEQILTDNPWHLFVCKILYRRLDPNY